MESSNQRANVNAASDEDTTDDDLDLVLGKPTSTHPHPVQERHQNRSPDGNSKTPHDPSGSRSLETGSPAKKVRSTLPKKQGLTSPQRSNVSDMEVNRAEESRIKSSTVADSSKASPRGASKVKGKIGGKKILPIVPAEPTGSQVLDTEQRPGSEFDSDNIEPKPHGSSVTHKECPISDEDQPRLHSSKVTPLPETPSERADQKRKQLKAQLEAQKQALTKKKRRF